jgi:hypothetical protein
VLSGEPDRRGGSLYLNVINEDAGGNVFVAPWGDDGNPGSITAPVQTIAAAMEMASFGDHIVLRDEGFYEFGEPGKHNVPKSDDGRFALTVRAAAGLDRDQVIIGQDGRRNVRPYTKVHWVGVSFDSATIVQYYEGDPWFDNVRWFNSNGRNDDEPLIPVRGPYHVTGGKAENKRYAYPNATLVRGVVVDGISGDVFQNSELIIGAYATDIDGFARPHHTDLIQYFGPQENIIVKDVTAEGIANAQTMFLEPTFQSADGSPRYTMEDAAFIRVHGLNDPVFYDDGTIRGGPPFSQVISSFEHVIIKDLQIPNQRFLMRTDYDHNQYFEAHNVLVDGAWLFPDSWDDLQNSTPNGFTVRNLSPSSGAESSLQSP